MALIMNDLEMNVALSTSEMADVNGGWDGGWNRLPEYRLPLLPRVGQASAYSTGDAVGVHYANVITHTLTQADHGFAAASADSYSEAG
jgi:hypothetical protein